MLLLPYQAILEVICSNNRSQLKIVVRKLLKQSNIQFMKKWQDLLKK